MPAKPLNIFKMKKSVAIFGSTGSIGKNALAVISQHLSAYQIKVLVAGEDVAALIAQAKIFQPQYVAINNCQHYAALVQGLAGFPDIKVVAGESEISQLATIKVDFFLSAIVGIAALIPTLNAIKAGCDIGMANKECLVVAGALMLAEAKKSGSRILPIDSEHNAIFQIFENHNVDKIARITLTASGGPFLHFSAEQMKTVSKEQAVVHPNWQMGKKISVDSATMMNKALEVIEAHQLFGVQADQINVVVHPQSIIHGLVDYQDGSTLAMLSQPDMKVSIASALAYPSRIAIKYRPLDLLTVGKLEFLPVDEVKFPAMVLVRQVLKSGGNAPLIFNVANEIAVARFLNGEISFNYITTIVAKTLAKMPNCPINNLLEIIHFNQQAANVARSF